MSTHGYTPEDALDTLMERIRKQSDVLAAVVQEAIDAGREEVADEETSPGPQGELLGRPDARDRTERPLRYARRPFSHDEALFVALDVLRAYFIEQPLMVNSTVRNLAPLLSADVNSHGRLVGRTNIEIDLGSETRMRLDDEQPFFLERAEEAQLEEQERNFSSLRELVRFSGE